MVDSPDLEPRVTALETQVRDLTQRVQHTAQDAAAARVLARGADRDVAEIRGEIREFRDSNNRVLNAMRDDLNDLRGDFHGLRGDFLDLREHVDNGFIEIRGRLDAAATGHELIANMLQTLIDKEPNA